MLDFISQEKCYLLNGVGWTEKGIVVKRDKWNI